MTHSPYSRYYRDKADKLFMQRYRGKPCAVCGTCMGTVGHHLLSKGAYPSLRCEPMNVIPLCDQHHGWSNIMAAHSTNADAVKAFDVWLSIAHAPRVYWMRDAMQAKGGRVNWREVWEGLRGEK